MRRARPQLTPIRLASSLLHFIFHFFPVFLRQSSEARVKIKSPCEETLATVGEKDWSFFEPNLVSVQCLNLRNKKIVTAQEIFVSRKKVRCLLLAFFLQFKCFHYSRFVMENFIAF